MAQMGFYFNEKNCINCKTCEIACSDWNDIRPNEWSEKANDVKWIDIVQEEEGTHDDLTLTTMVAPCFHCEEPACVDAAPEHGVYKREEDGLVFVELSNLSESDTQAVVDACPFDRMQVADEDMPATSGYPDGRPAGLPQKCTGCFDKDGEEPACVNACPTGAIEFGDIAELREKHPDASQDLLKEFYGADAVEKTKPAVIIED
ncbi:MAG TPA: 4Fe-4S dicluster domain-containing protein [Natrialbaceae archaeon]|nr:4Fe-4S dicluster domain-containing protein [Natrialbaceae archaeon]